MPIYVDLLFYHVRLHCYVVIELKTGEFQPEYAGKLSFYISAIDGTMRAPGEVRPWVFSFVRVEAAQSWSMLYKI
jgi:hypothetical protein